MMAYTVHSLSGQKQDKAIASSASVVATAMFPCVET